MLSLISFYKSEESDMAKSQTRNKQPKFALLRGFQNIHGTIAL